MRAIKRTGQDYLAQKPRKGSDSAQAADVLAAVAAVVVAAAAVAVAAAVVANDLVAHYRSRVERVIHRVKPHAWCQVAFRGSFALLVQFLEITVMTTALEIRTEFLEHRRPMFEVVGPWDHVFQ